MINIAKEARDNGTIPPWPSFETPLLDELEKGPWLSFVKCESDTAAEVELP